MNTTRSQMKWLWLYLQGVYQQEMLLFSLVNRLYVYPPETVPSCLVFSFQSLDSNITLLKFFFSLWLTVSATDDFSTAKRYSQEPWRRYLSFPTSTICQGTAPTCINEFCCLQSMVIQTWLHGIFTWYVSVSKPKYNHLSLSCPTRTIGLLFIFFTIRWLVKCCCDV